MISKFRLISLVFLSVIMFSFALAETKGITQVSFSTGGDYNCQSGDFEAHWVKPSTGETVSIFNLNSNVNVSGECNNTLRSSEWCCPKNYRCTDGRCVVSSLLYVGDVCTTLTDNETCVTAPSSFATTLMDKFGPGYSGTCSSGNNLLGYLNAQGELCSNLTICGCGWDSDKKKCLLNVSEQNICGDDIISSSSCSWTEDSSKNQDLCETEGKIEIVYAATNTTGYNGQAVCLDKVIDYPCSVTVQLPFFNKFNFLFSVLAIVGIYFVFGRKF